MEHSQSIETVSNAEIYDVNCVANTCNEDGSLDPLLELPSTTQKSSTEALNNNSFIPITSDSSSIVNQSVGGNNTITPIAKIKCNLCNAYFKHEYKYKIHLAKHEQAVKVDCNVCGKSISNNRFVYHVMVHTGEKPHVCRICGRGFRLNRDLKQHNFTHTGERPYPCPMCGKKFADTSARRKHFQTHTGERPYSCEICQRAFTQISHLREHQVTHTREKSHTCELCGKKFTTKSSMQRHILTHTNTCEVCHSTFTTNHKLQKHRELHNVERPFSCVHCEKRFLKKTDLNTHLLIHSEERNVICKICDGAFKSYRYLRVHHYHYHKGMALPFKCPYCNKGFFQEASLKRHSVVHSRLPKRRVKCPDCGITFSSSESLEQHGCQRNFINYFECNLCDKKYKNKSDLHKHTKKCHSFPSKNSFDPSQMEQSTSEINSVNNLNDELTLDSNQELSPTLQDCDSIMVTNSSCGSPEIIISDSLNLNHDLQEHNIITNEGNSKSSHSMPSSSVSNLINVEPSIFATNDIQNSNNIMNSSLPVEPNSPSVSSDSTFEYSCSPQDFSLNTFDINVENMSPT